MIQLSTEQEEFETSKDSEKLLKRLDVLAEKVDTLTLVTAISIQKEKFFKGKKQKELIEFLDKLGLPRNIIALIVGTTPSTVSVTLSKMKPKKRKKKTMKESKQEEKVE